MDRVASSARVLLSAKLVALPIPTSVRVVTLDTTSILIRVNALLVLDGALRARTLLFVLPPRLLMESLSLMVEQWLRSAKLAAPSVANLLHRFAILANLDLLS